MKFTRIIFFVLAFVLIACQGVEGSSTGEFSAGLGTIDGVPTETWEPSTDLYPTFPVMLTCEGESFDVPGAVECSVASDISIRTKTAKETVEYSRKGLIIAREYDCAAPYEASICGPSRCLERWHRDKQGRVTEYTNEEGAGGEIFERETWAYNDAGQPLYHRAELSDEATLEAWDYGPEGNVSSYYVDGELWTYNDAGQPTAREVLGGALLEGWSYDGEGRVSSHGDFSLDEVIHGETYAYENNGSVEMIVYHFDSSGSDADYWVEVNNFDPSNRATSRALYTVENLTERTLEEAEAWNYNKAGELLTYTFDNDGDGLTDYEEVWTYNNAGEVVRHITDSDGDGVVDNLEEWSFNDAGRLVEYRREADGELEWVEFWYHEGKRLKMHSEHDRVTGEESLEVWTHDDDGRLVAHTERDTDMELVFSESWTFNEDGLLTGYVLDQNGDGIPERSNTVVIGEDRLLYGSDLDGHQLQNGDWAIFGDGRLDARVVTARTPGGEVLWIAKTDVKGDQTVKVFGDHCPDTMSFDIH